MNTFSDLVSAWRQTQLKKAPFILSGDDAILKYSHIFRNYKDFVKNRPDFWEKKTQKFHLGLIPIPFLGNIKKAKVYVLSLNPGLTPVDYYAETYDNKIKKERKRELRQQKFNTDYPFHFLNPEYSWSSRYWHSRFSKIVEELSGQLSSRQKIAYIRALKRVSQRITCLELVPYHSKSFHLSRKVIEELQSVKLMRAFVNQYVYRKAVKGDAIIVVMRGDKHWGVKNHRNVLRNDQRAAYFTPKNSKRIIDMLL